jgi:hypothetical protein
MGTNLKENVGLCCRVEKFVVVFGEGWMDMQIPMALPVDVPVSSPHSSQIPSTWHNCLRSVKPGSPLLRPVMLTLGIGVIIHQISYVKLTFINLIVTENRVTTGLKVCLRFCIRDETASDFFCFVFFGS